MIVQPALFPQIGEPLDFRLVHYMGSKLRLIDAIREVVDQIVPAGGRVCDLFAGSGAVSLGLRHAWSVTSIDIQEYSRVLCSAILTPPQDASERRRILRDVDRSNLRRRLQHALAPVVEYERSTLEDAAAGSMERLCELIEEGSLFLASGDSNVGSPLAVAQKEARQRLVAEGLGSGKSSVISRYFGGVYFSWAQALELDAIVDLAHGAPAHARDQLLAAAISVASDVALCANVRETTTPGSLV